jgi:hypothetical protein
MKRLCLSIVPLVLFVTSLSGIAQTVTGAIRGTITDSSGAIVPGASAVATNTATGVTTTARTNQAGEFSIRFLQIGQYTLAIEAEGFDRATYGPFALEIDQTAKIDIALKVGSTKTSVEVTDQLQPILNTESATLGETFTSNTIDNMPLNGRDFTELSVYTPGAVAPGFSSFGMGDSNERAVDAGNEVSVNGNRQQSNNYLLDGQEINENLNNTLGYNPSPDALEQIRVISSNANAEFGNVNGGTILAVMKSGTNKFHGSAFAFLHNYNLDANSWANDNHLTVTPKNPYTNTQFGGTFGGPIFHDKLFFFVDYEALRYHGAGQTTANLAPAAFRTGDLSGIGHQLYDTQHLDENGKPTPYANNQVPITNPVALYLFSNPKAYPLPNNPTSDPLGIQGNFIGPTGSFSRNDQGDAKIDWKLRESDSVAFRYSQGYAQDGQTTDPLPIQFPIANNYPDHFFDANWRHTFSPAIVNLFTANYGRIRFNNGVSTDPSGIFGLTGNQLVGIPGNPQQTAGFSSQNMDGTGGAGYPDGFGTNPSPEIFIDNIFGYSDYLTWQKGRHLLKFGGEFLRYQQNSFYPGNDGELGAFNYNGQFTASPLPDQPSTPYPFADFLVDRAQDVQIGAVGGRTGQRQWRDGVFAQDDYKARPNLTLNIGIRWEFDQPIYEVNNKMANIDMQSKQIIYAGVDGNSRALYDPTYTQFQPRVGFAYQPTARTVIRAGYGISSYVEGTGANLRLTQNPPFHTDFEKTAVSPVGTENNVGQVTSYSPGVYYQASNGFPTTQVPATTFYVWPKNFKPSITQEFSLTTEYQLNSTASFQLGYVGIIGHHLTDPYWGNQKPSPDAPAPYANIVGDGGVIKITQTESASNYNALQAVFRQRFRAGLELTANYTFSKSLTDDIGFYGVSNIFSGQYYQQNAYDMRSEWGLAGMDTKHNISVTGVYELPFGRGKRFGTNWNYYTNSLLGGWKLSGADIYYSGFPVTISANSNYSSLVNAFGGAARPNQLSHLHAEHKSINAYYGTDVQPIAVTVTNPDGSTTINEVPTYCAADKTISEANRTGLTTQPCVFQDQSFSSFGSLRPGSLRAPSFQNIDMSLSKTFGVWKEHTLAFRIDAFNTFNIADYAPPDSNMIDTNFGQITGTVNGNRSLSLSLKYAF